MTSRDKTYVCFEKKLFRVFKVFVSSTVFVLAGCQTSNPIPQIDGERLELETNRMPLLRGQAHSLPPRSIEDLSFHLPPPKLAPWVENAQECQGVDVATYWIETFKEYMKLYAPYEEIDKKLHPVGGWKIKYAWALPKLIALSEIRRGNFPASIEYLNKYINRIPINKTAIVSAYAQLAIAHTLAGELDKAEEALRKSKVLYKTRHIKPHLVDTYKQWISHADAEYSLAIGDLTNAEKHFKNALTLHRKRGRQQTALHPTLRSHLSDTYLYQNRLIDAEIEVRKAISQMIKKEDINRSSFSPPILSRFAKILYDQGRIEDSEEIAASAVWLFQDLCVAETSIEFALARKALADIYTLQGRWEEAYKLFEAIERGLRTLPNVLQNRFLEDLTWAWTLINLNRDKEALSRLESALESREERRGEKDLRDAAIQGYIAIVKYRSGNLLEAEEFFNNAVDSFLDDSGGGLAVLSSNVRRHHIQRILEHYLELLTEKGASLKDVANIDVTLQIVEFLRNSLVQKTVAAMGARDELDNKKLSELIRREQDLRARRHALNESILRLLDLNPSKATSVEEELKQVRQDHADVLEDIRDLFPDYMEMLSPKRLKLREIQDLLKPEEALIATYSGELSTYTWAVRKESALLTKSKLSKYDLEQVIRDLRSALDVKANTVTEIPPFSLDAARALYSEVLAPSGELWRSASRLITVQHGPLGYFPFTLFPLDGQSESLASSSYFSEYRKVDWLVRNYSVVTLPAVTSLRILRDGSKQRSAKKSFIGFGDPVFNPARALKTSQENTEQSSTVVARRATVGTIDLNSASIKDLPALPETANEIRQLAQLFDANPETDVFLRFRANETNVKKAYLDEYKVVAFATHGLVPGDLDGLIQPALAMSAPEDSAPVGDGLLTMEEIMGLKLDSDLVLLSACNSGSSNGGGAEAISGLGRAFIYAGARSLLVSGWPVETHSALQLTTKMAERMVNYRELPEEALRHAMLGLIEGSGKISNTTGKELYSYAHPLFWAPFSLVGETSATIH